MVFAVVGPDPECLEISKFLEIESDYNITDSAEYAPEGLDKEILQSAKENNTVGSREKPFLLFTPLC